ncbi:hypothetical protein CDAR_119651 [Caerostris darwini]|uniref:Uncharacterized protein n=1 Tax=Caerostris darwini TaxID=1538125 RepID=A0AAV4SES3_9ARAC|nr:hypothetical protein CDAR_119651 [Caerostris darwini]
MCHSKWSFICPDDYVLDGNECRKVKCSQRRCIGGDCRVLRGNVEDCVCPVGHVLIDDTCTCNVNIK